MDIKSLVKRTQNLKVLYIEDNDDVRSDGKDFLNKFFIHIDTASDGLDGLNKYKDFFKQQKSCYDLVISDITMPKLDGIKMSEKILNINKKQSILIFSAHNESDKLVKLIDLGVSNFVQKPLEIGNFCQILEKIINNIFEYKNLIKNIDKIKSLNLEYNSIINDFNRFVIAARTDLNGIFIDISKAFENISGYSKKELIGRRPNILRDSQMPKVIYQELWENIKVGKIWSGELRNINKNGKPYWIHSTISPYMDEKDEVIGYNAICEDITQRKEIEFLNKQIRKQSLELEKTNEKIKDLLDNAGQGFLSCTKDMIIEKDFSIECTKMLVKDLEGKNISELLFSDDEIKKDLFESGFNYVLNETDENIKEELFSLMPNTYCANNRIINIEYKALKNSRIMLIFSDITKQKELEDKIQRERQEYKMVISVVNSYNEFLDIRSDFLKFIDECEDKNVEEHLLKSFLSYLIRKIHTFKGLFLQKEFIHISKAMHMKEVELEAYFQTKEYNVQKLKSIVLNNGFKVAFEKDMEILTNILGKEFFKQTSSLKIDIDFIKKIENKIAKEINKNENADKEFLISLLKDIKCLKANSLLNILDSYARYIEKVATILDKKIEQIKVKCDKYILISQKQTPFIKALLHVFRNAIVHGIEKPDIRLENGKDEKGQIKCKVEQTKKYLIITISDDGKGIDVNSIREKALYVGYTKSYINNLDDNEVINLIFNDNLTTIDNINEFGGSGIGLGAIHEELKKINGHCEIVNSAGKGVKFIFQIPFD